MISKLYVGNLAYSVTDASLLQHFSEFGDVSSAKVMMDRDSGRSKGFGFVEMPRAEERHRGREHMCKLEYFAGPNEFGRAQHRFGLHQVSGSALIAGAPL